MEPNAVCSAALGVLQQVANVEARLSGGDAQTAGVDRGLNDLLQSLAALRRAGGECADLVLPAGVVSDVDLGRNPAAFTARLAEETTIANQATKGRIEAFAELHSRLSGSLPASR